LNVLQKNMKNILLIIAIVFAFCPLAYAGGDSFLIEIVSLTPKENGEYRMEFIQHGAPYGKKLEGDPKRVVLHLRYNKAMFGAGTAYASQENYDAAIAFLKDQAEKKGKALFGVMAQGYLPIKEKENEYQSNALQIAEQADGERVVFSYPRKL
jgi:hypothetical protein